jgi:hypothetical protein
MRRAREVVGDAPQVFLRGSRIGQLQRQIKLVRGLGRRGEPRRLSLSLFTLLNQVPNQDLIATLCFLACRLRL